MRLILFLVALAAALAAAPRRGGNYGNWTADGLGLPVFEYTFDQVADRPAHPPSTANPWTAMHWSSLPLSGDSTARASSEHVFQLGNDRIVVIPNNYGAIRVRQDEGSPKWLTDSYAAYPAEAPAGATQFGGGFGYLIDSATQQPLLTTYYTGSSGGSSGAVPSWQPASLMAGSSSRDFGIGYATMAAAAKGWSVEHTSAVPFGDDPVVLLE